MQQYLDLLRHVLENGTDKGDRTGTGTISTFGYQMRFDLADSFPLVTTKKMFLKGIIHELLWFISGDTNIKYLKDNGVKIWDEWADENGDLGPVYGEQWRKWKAADTNKVKHYTDGDFAKDIDVPVILEIDQLKDVIEAIKKNPNSRRHIVSAWNPGVIEKMALPPCHCFFQFYVADGKLSCQLYQRSADVFLGVPFNIASYALLTMMVAQVCDLELGEFVHTFGDVHIYKNHIDQVKLQLTREPKPGPKMVINPEIKDIDDFKYEDFKIEGYEHHPAIKGEISV